MSKEQLGHSSIELTVGTYGRWLRKRAPGAVDRLDVLSSENSGPATDDVVAKTGEVVADEAGSATQAIAAPSRNSSDFRNLAERGGFEPPVQVNPAQQVSKANREESDDTSLDLNPS